MSTESAPPADPVRSAAKRRAAWTRPLIATALAGDVVCGAAVMLATLFSHDRAFSAPDVTGILLVAAVWPVLLLLTGGYDARRLGDGPEELQAIVRSGVWMLAGLSVLLLTVRQDPPRRYVLIAIPVIAVLTGLHRQVQRKRLHRARAHGHALLRTLVVGETVAVERYCADLNAHRHHGYNVVGACLTVGSAPPGNPFLPTWGTFSEVPQVVVEQQIDVVLDGSDPLSTLRWVTARYPGLAVVALSATTNTEQAARALEAGAVAWVPKSAGVDEMAAVVRRAAADEASMPTAVLRQLVRRRPRSRPAC